MLINKETAELLIHAIHRYGNLDLPAHGCSMFPLIRKGQICRFVPCDSSLLKRGDIALFRTMNGQLVAHRFCRFETIDSQSCLIFKGDTNLYPDEPVSEGQLIGKLTAIHKGNDAVHVTDSAVMLWSRLILAVPLLSLLLRMVLIRLPKGSNP